MRETIDTNDGIVELGNVLRSKDGRGNSWIARKGFGEPEGYDVYLPCVMDEVDRYYLMSLIWIADGRVRFMFNADRFVEFYNGLCT